MENRFFYYIILLLLLLAIGKMHFSHGRVISGDGRYYYAQLRSTIMDGDWNFENDLKMYNPNQQSIAKERIHPITGKMIIKYPLGTAIMMMPGFVIAWIVSQLFILLGFQETVSGYEYSFQFFVQLSAISATLGGVLYSTKLWQSIRGKSTLEVGIIAGFYLLASPLVYYAAIEPSMSHAYSFLCVSAYIYYTKKWMEGRLTYWESFLMVFFAALMILVRNQNLFFLIFSIWALIMKWRFNERGELKQLAWMIPLGFLLLLPQFLYWSYLFDSPLTFSYQEEGFSRWNQPEFWNVLFSSDTGLFYWHPIIFLGLLSLLLFAQKDKAFFVLFSLCFIIQLYLSASWSCWWLGNSFGYRGLINCTSLFMIGYFYFAETLITKGKSMQFYIISSLLVLSNLLVLLAYSMGSIPHKGPLSYVSLIDLINTIFN